MAPGSPIAVNQQDGVLHATLCSPPDNALTPSLIAALAELVDTFEHSDASVLVLGSAYAESFSASGETNSSRGSAQQLADYRDALRRPLERLAACGRPSIAVIEGRALGAGLELALACTLRFCAPTARFGMPDLATGRIPAAGGTQRLPALIGRGRTLELLLTGREVQANEALRIGLVERIVYRDVMHEAHDTAVAMARLSLPAMGAVISCVDAARDLPHSDGLAVEGVAVLAMVEDDPWASMAVRGPAAA